MTMFVPTWKWDAIFDARNAEQSLQQTLESDAESSGRSRSEPPQIHIPIKRGVEPHVI